MTGQIHLPGDQTLTNPVAESQANWIFVWAETMAAAWTLYLQQKYYNPANTTLIDSLPPAFPGKIVVVANGTGKARFDPLLLITTAQVLFQQSLLMRKNSFAEYITKYQITMMENFFRQITDIKNWFTYLLLWEHLLSSFFAKRIR